MALHKLLLGDATEAARLLPLARHGLSRLKERMLTGGLSTGSHRYEVKDGGSIRVSVVEGEEFIRIKAGAPPLVFWGTASFIAGTQAGLYATRVTPGLSDPVSFKRLGTFTSTDLFGHPLHIGVAGRRLIGMAFDRGSSRLDFYKVPLKAAGLAAQLKPPFFQVQLPPEPIPPPTHPNNNGWSLSVFKDLIYKDRIGVAYGPITAINSTSMTYRVASWDYKGVQVGDATFTVPTPDPIPNGSEEFLCELFQGTQGHFYTVLWIQHANLKQYEVRVTKRHISAPNVVVTTYPTILTPVAPTLYEFDSGRPSGVHGRDGLLFIGWANYFNTGPGNSALWKFDLWVFDDETGALLTSLTDTNIRQVVTDRGSLYALTMSTVSYVEGDTVANIPISVDLYSLKRNEATVELTFKRTLSTEGDAGWFTTDGGPLWPILTDTSNFFNTIDV